MNGRSTPLQYRFLAAMQGALGIGANLNKFSAEDTAMATKMVATYKRIRNTVQLGDLYRLYSPRTGDVAANQYVAADGRQSVLFVFRHSQEYSAAPPAIHLQGLDPKALYRLESIDDKLVERQPQLSGAYLMQAGLNVTLRGDFDSTAVILEKVQ
jgi:alpha-galactosidase